ncbi:DAK2 domain-containing protein [Spiroplasma turonicum]|uniref:Dihydroxyacetone/glyceraldehyde kinase n=1 Tax=Spiroplasma turonicum TaxID=216946 RepID=A0A0K1P574_9MOLU|nr:DAK2 domain-containing protein [Spiroplasma turonicum]AKU79433.1 dihydroxyacetone/glyceraldehyde kinase [Spiroplasma turonicum]ALX70454.1 dihydroxyacetone/glyceraldehyde kinase [Spiroplasma turonicum]
MKQLQFLKNMLTSGVNNVYNNYPKIDKLNVFPVPDGDTGTNMNLTCTNGLSEIENDNYDSVSDLMSKFSRGLIMGARGNSGVIFSQIVKGFANGLKLDDSLSTKSWKLAFKNAKEVAYSAVMKPVEGTILTVIRETSEDLNNLNDDIDQKELWDFIIKSSKKSLDNTPELLPVLKEVGVVDSGGYGLLKFFEGMEKYVRTGKIVSKLKKLEENLGNNIEVDSIDEFGYCTEAIVNLMGDYIDNLNVDIVRNTLEGYGNTSIVAVTDSDILKIHTHALMPGQVLTYLQQYGEFKSIKVENMNLQAEKHTTANGKKDSIINDKDKKRTLKNDVATISVARSKGIADYLKEQLSVDYVIDGGAKMNPSTNDFLEAIEKVDAKTVYIFPNDSNVLLAAKQAKDLEKLSKVVVIETTTIPEGITAYLNLDPDESPKKNESSINKALKNVTSISINKAARDAKIDNVDIKENQYMSSVNRKVFAASESLNETIVKVLSKNINSKTEIITIFTGADATFKDISNLRKYLDENFDVEYELIEGGQEVYLFIIGIE